MARPGRVPVMPLAGTGDLEAPLGVVTDYRLGRQRGA